jgi:WD40 repeat protein
MKGGSGGKVVEPGDIASKMIGCVLQTATPKMPPEGEKLAATQIDILKQWIEGGLLENKTSSARKPSKPKFETALRSDPAKKPDGPPPVPVNVLLEPPVVTTRAAAVHSIALSPWAPLLAITGQRQILLHDTNTLELVGVLPFPEGDPVSLAFTPDARYLIVGGGVPGKSGVTVTFDVTTGSRLLTAAKEFDSILAADIKPGFDIVATGGPSKLLKLWKTDTGEQIFSVKKHTDWITAIDISNDGVLLASGDRNGGVYVWETDTASEYQALRGHQAGITGLAFRADSNSLASASEDGSVRMWEMNGGSEVKKIDAHPGGVTAFSFARDGSFITAGRDKKAKLWKADFSPLRDLAGPFPELPTAAAFDPETNRAFVADAAGTVRVFETTEGKLIGEILANPPTIEARLKTLADLANQQQQTLAKAEAAAKQTADVLDTARKALAEAEKNHKQSTDIHQAAAAGAQQAKQQLDALKQSLQSQRDEIARLANEKATAQADLDAKRQALAAAPENQRDPIPVTTAEQKAQQLSDQLSKIQVALETAQKEEPSLTIAFETAIKTAGVAQARIQPAEAAIPPARQAVEAAEKSAAEALAAIEPVKAELPKIHAAEKHWSAAAINTHAIQAAREAEQTTLESEGELDTFSAATLAIEPQAAALNAKRDQQQKLQEYLTTKPGLTDDFKTELAATIAALDISIEREAAALRKLQNDALAIRTAVEQKIPLAHQALAQANQLKQAYEKARQ